MKATKEALMLYCCCSSQEEAETIAGLLLKEKLVACCNILPSMTSMYVWKGKLEKDQETLLLAKTLADKKEEIKKLISQNHSYDCPAVVFYSIEDGLPEYLSWLEESVSR